MTVLLRSAFVLLVAQLLSSAVYAQPPLFLRCSVDSQELDIRLASTPPRVLDFATFSCVDGNGVCEAAMTVENHWRSDTNLAVMRIDSSVPTALLTQVIQVPAANSCTSVPLAPTNPLRWVGTAVWVESSSEMLVLDPLSNQIFSISTGGIVVPDKRGLTLASRTIDAFLPARLERFDNGYLLTLLDSNAIVIDSTYSIRLTSGNLQKNPDGTITNIGNLTDLLMTGNDLVAYGSIRSSTTSSFSLGFIHAHIKARPWQVKEAKLLSAPADQKYYLLGHRYIASTDSGIYFVAMREGSASLLRYNPGDNSPKALKSLPSEYSAAPAIKTVVKRPADAVLLFQEIERLRMPVGLYGQGRYLYLLTRKPSTRSNETEWRLHQIDPTTDRLTGTLKLPTLASHLTIIPARNAWYILEKGSVEAPGRQDVKSMIVLPVNWIAEPKRSPLNENNTELVQCQTIRQPVRQGGSTN